MTSRAKLRLLVAVAVTARMFISTQAFADTTPPFIRMWGSQGSGPGQFDRPSGIDIGPDGSVLVVNIFGQRVEKFDSTGAFLIAWGSQGGQLGQFHQELRGVAVSTIRAAMPAHSPVYARSHDRAIVQRASVAFPIYRVDGSSL